MNTKEPPEIAASPGFDWSRELLSDSEDTELQRIVEEAARTLSSPMALVTLLLDEVQFFKAHAGLPPELAAARATRRDVSFCQFVARDEAPFEVNDAPADARVPQFFPEEYDVRSYYGVPIRADGRVVGSLCVLDTKARDFSDGERRSLQRLAARVDDRLRTLVGERRRARLELAEAASGPALTELRQSLEPLRGLVGDLRQTLVALRAFLRLSSHALDGGSVSSEAMSQSLASGGEAIERAEDLLEDIWSMALDGEDCVRALEQLAVPSATTRLSDVITAAQDLARPSTRAAGGAPFPEMSYDPMLAVSRPLAVALLVGALSAVADHLAEAQSAPGVRMRVRDAETTAELILSAEGLNDEAAQAIAARLSEQLGDLPSARIHPLSGSVRVAYRVAPGSSGA